MNTRLQWYRIEKQENSCSKGIIENLSRGGRNLGKRVTNEKKISRNVF